MRGAGHRNRANGAEKFLRLGDLDIEVEEDIGEDALAFDLVRITDDRGIGDGLVFDKGALDLGGAEAVPRRWPATSITSSTRPVIQ